MKRIEDVNSYNLIGSPPSEVLNDITKLASLLYDVPISLVTFLDDHKQWFLSNIGLNIENTDREVAFCEHALQNPNEVLVVIDPEKDERFKNNPLVTHSPHVRFYAGAPLKTPHGNVLGTLCILDTKARTFSKNQEKALKILAKKAMVFIENYKTIYSQRQKIFNHKLNLQKITNEVPIGIYQLKISSSGSLNVLFLSKEVYSLYPNLDIHNITERPWSYLRVLNAVDSHELKHKWMLANKLKKELEVEFRTLDGKWHYTKAVPEHTQNDEIIWYGFIKDISERMEYQETLEQILFDISHVLRKPISNLVGLVNILNEEQLDREQLREFKSDISSVSDELERFTEKLNRVYHAKHQELIA